MNRITYAKILIMVGILAAGCASGFAQSADARLESFFQSYLDTWFNLRPYDASKLGDHRFDNRLDDLSKPARERYVDFLRKTQKDLPKAVDVKQLSPQAKIDYEIFAQDLKRGIWQAENLHPYENDPRVYGDYISDSVFTPLTQSTQPKEVNISNSLARMEQIPAIVAAAKANLENPPRDILDTAIRQNKGAIAFYEQDIFEIVGKTPQLPALKSSAARVVTTLKDYQKFLETEVLPRANGDWRIGQEKFYKKLELEMDAGVNADQVLADALAEYDRVQRDMYVIARQLWSKYYPKQLLPADDAVGRAQVVRNVLSKIGLKHSEPKRLVKDVRSDVSAIKDFIADSGFLKLPNPDRCQIIEMPEFQRGNSTAYMNSPPPLDSEAAGFYAVSPPPKDWDAAKVNSYLEEYNDCMLQILTIHEAYPGHYVQFEYANKNLSKIRRIIQSGPYIEGWAVYTEQSMLDHGYGKGNLELRLTQQKFYLRAVVNSILDHRMHCDRLSDEDAMKLLVDGAYQSEGEARLKVLRAKQSSVQLSTYFVGRMAHYRLRQAVERELGDRFNLADYHKAVLDPGPVALKFLPQIVRRTLNLSK